MHVCASAIVFRGTGANLGKSGNAEDCRMMRRHLGYLMAGAGDGRRPTLRGIATDRSAMVFITLAFVGMAALLTRTTAARLELRRLSRESTAWLRARGQVLDTRIVWSSSPRAGKAYWPTIHYRYSVGGTTFVGERVSFRPSYGRAEAEEAVSKFPVGSPVTVWFRPGDPGKAVLEPNTWRGGLAMVLLVPSTIAAIILALVCLAVLFLVSKPRR
jgi:hypothetical protein